MNDTLRYDGLHAIFTFLTEEERVTSCVLVCHTWNNVVKSMYGRGDPLGLIQYGKNVSAGRIMLLPRRVRSKFNIKKY
jgi:hypothetical protein